jgi:hypothetical protein
MFEYQNPKGAFVKDFWMVWMHGAFLVKYIKVFLLMKTIGAHSIMTKDFWSTKNTCPQVFIGGTYKRSLET